MRLGTECLRLGLDFSQLALYPSPGVPFTDHIKPAIAAAQSMVLRAQVMGFQDGFVFAGLVVLASVPICLGLSPSAHHHRKAPDPKGSTVEAESVDGAQ
jgi:hypothetical protein